MAKKKRPPPGAQITLSLPPELTDDLVHYSSRFKLLYPSFLIFLIKGDYYVTLDWDALTTSQEADQPLVVGTPEMSYVRTNQMTGVMLRLTSAGYFLAICHPPEEPIKHLFT